MINLNPTVWGPHAWFLIDSIILSFPDKPDTELQNELKQFFFSLSKLLPCEKCRYHFSEYIKKTDLINIDFSSKDKIIKWINTIHNNISQNNNGKQINIKNMLKFYDTKYNIDTKTSFIDIMYLIISIFIIILIIKYFYHDRYI